MRLTSSAPCLAAWRVMSTIWPASVVELGPPLQQPQPAQDRGEQIVEVMGEAAGQLADRIQPLRLHQLVFELPPLGDVEQRAEDFGRVAIGILGDDALVEENAIVVVGAAPAEFAGIAARLARALPSASATPADRPDGRGSARIRHRR